MPRNSSGVYTLPEAAFIAGTTILSADLNSNFSDIATALTESVASTGVTPMTGPLLITDGSQTAPGLAFVTDTGIGLGKVGSQIGFVFTGYPDIPVIIDGSGTIMTNLVVENLTVTGGIFSPGTRNVGEVVDYGGTAAPSLWLLAYGQAISRSTYSVLFGVIGTTFGSGDGSTTFNVPDLRGRVVAGADDMGGVAANRLTTASGMTTGLLGGTGGTETIILVIANLATHTHSITDPGHTHTVTDPGHTHAHNAGTVNASFNGVVTSITDFAAPNVAATLSSATTGITLVANTTGITNSTTGSGSAHINVQPTLVMNKIIYTAV